MAQYDEDEELDLNEMGERPVLDANIRKQLREAEKMRKELDAARQELEAQKREVLFSKAGIPDDGIGKYFRKGYDGDVSIEAIRAAAEADGILQRQATPEPSYDHELEALRRAQGATIGTVGATPDPQQEYFAALAQAKSVEEVMAIANSETGRRVGVSGVGMR